MYYVMILIGRMVYDLAQGGTMYNDLGGYGNGIWKIIRVSGSAIAIAGAAL